MLSLLKILRPARGQEDLGGKNQPSARGGPTVISSKKKEKNLWVCSPKSGEARETTVSKRRSRGEKSYSFWTVAPTNHPSS